MGVEKGCLEHNVMPPCPRFHLSKCNDSKDGRAGAADETGGTWEQEEEEEEPDERRTCIS